MEDKNLVKTLDTLMAELKRRQDEECLIDYKPCSFHWEFLTDWVKAGKKKSLFIGSNQSGKTTVACVLVRAIALGYHSWIKTYAKYVKRKWEFLKFPKSGYWFKDQFDTAHEAYEYIMSFEDIPGRTPTRVAVCVKDFKVGVGKVFEPKLKELVPLPHKKGKYIENIERMQGKIAEKIVWANGSETHFFSGEQDTFRFEGGTWDAVFWDEPPKQEHYVAMDRGTLVKDSPMFFTLTPLSEPWLFDTLLQDVKKPGSEVHLSTCDLFSEEVHWMTEKKKNDFKREIKRQDPHQVEARVHGKFTHLLGRIYPTYDENVHLIPHSEVEQFMSQNDTVAGYCVDPHDRRPFAIAFFVIDSNNDIYYYKNYPTDPMPDIKSCDLTVKKYAEMLKDEEARILKEFGIRTIYRFGDPNKFNTPRKLQDKAGQTLLDDFAELKIYFDVEINNSIADGHSVVRDLLYYDTEKPIDFTNKPKMYVSDDCWNVNTGFGRYTWNEKKSKELASEIPHEKWKDHMDCVRYVTIKHPIYIDQATSMIYTPSVKGRIYD